MDLFLQFLSLFLLLSLSNSEREGPRDSVCRSNNKGFLPFRGHGLRPKLNETKFNVTIMLVKEDNNQTVTCVEEKTRYRGRYFFNVCRYSNCINVLILLVVIIKATKFFKGFIITSTQPGTYYPANFEGRFDRKVRDYSEENLLYCCDNTISHS